MWKGFINQNYEVKILPFRLFKTNKKSQPVISPELQAASIHVTYGKLKVPVPFHILMLSFKLFLKCQVQNFNRYCKQVLISYYVRIIINVT